MDFSETGRADQKKIPFIEEQGRALMQAVPDLVFLLGLDGSYIDIFSAADEDLFLPREELIGRTVLEVLPSPVGEDCMAAIGRLDSPRDVSSFSYELQIDGRPRWFEGRVALCGEETVIVLVRDFTEQRLAEQNLREANRALQRRAQQLQQMEQEFTRVEQRERRRMAQLLHDNLQQLLVGAKFNLSLLADGVSSSKNREGVQEIMEIIDEAISHSRALTTELYPTFLYEGSLEQSFGWIKRDAARLHGLDVNVTLPPEGRLVLADSMRFTVFNAIRELLFNVAKHAGVGQAEIEVKQIADRRFAVTVSDQGRGFDVQVGSRLEANLDKFGLISLRERIANLGGSVDISSRPGAGCTVTLHLPIQEEERPAGGLDADDKELPHHAEPQGPAPSGERAEGSIGVLLVDDHSLIRVGLARLLKEDSSITIVGEAEDGETAVELASRLRPDVVLMDVSMPGLGGVEATRAIKRANPEIEVIALSMHEEQELGSEIRDAGASDYVNKSQAASRIGDAVRACYAKKRGGRP